MIYTLHNSQVQDIACVIQRNNTAPTTFALFSAALKSNTEKPSFVYSLVYLESKFGPEH